MKQQHISHFIQGLGQTARNEDSWDKKDVDVQRKIDAENPKQLFSSLKIIYDPTKTRYTLFSQQITRRRLKTKNSCEVVVIDCARQDGTADPSAHR
ncbi:hypothetical protein CHS0354_003167 [Potamilus streckersoni]|uniref:Uncharacterized protein n=1 Tax=Potamilus streckersoni TaxID=2493646 RepID=A0AAE0TF26_9BIVA|nr:hypothetical protein CHS0354_003167 [Potamilus streckersoni]